jgi:hypothetical protein
MKIHRFNEFDAIDESLPNKNTIDQLKMVRKLSKGTDIGDRISDMNKEGENLHYMHNAIDSGIESFQDFKKSNKDFVPSWNVKNVDPFGKKYKK